MTSEIPIGVLTVSDRSFKGEYEDRSGPAIVAYLDRVLSSAWRPVARVVPDEQPLIESALIEMVEQHDCWMIVTTGGTGPAPRDVTPEATAAVVEKVLPGFGEAMRGVSRLHVPTAILSRQMAGIRGRSLIVNLPGSPKAIDECLDVVFPAIPDCLDLLGRNGLETKEEHFRPHLS